MAVKSKRRKSTRRAVRKVVLGGLSRLRKGPQQGEEVSEPPRDAANANGAGILRGPNTRALRLPHALAEAGEYEEDTPNGWLPGPIVFIITGLAIVFICILTWFVSQMPEK
jgi:hypothetical protein